MTKFHTQLVGVECISEGYEAELEYGGQSVPDTNEGV
jgi:hypothetical protein